MAKALLLHGQKLAPVGFGSTIGDVVNDDYVIVGFGYVEEPATAT